eukprot:472541-Alexandrium_andersonii.AAC.1
MPTHFKCLRYTARCISPVWESLSGNMSGYTLRQFSVGGPAVSWGPSPSSISPSGPSGTSALLSWPPQFHGGGSEEF